MKPMFLQTVKTPAPDKAELRFFHEFTWDIFSRTAGHMFQMDVPSTASRVAHRLQILGDLKLLLRHLLLAGLVGVDGFIRIVVIVPEFSLETLFSSTPSQLFCFRILSFIR
jgi:hypothetical protein